MDLAKQSSGVDRVAASNASTASTSIKLTDLPLEVLTRIISLALDPSCVIERDGLLNVWRSPHEWAELNSIRASCRILLKACRNSIIDLAST